MIKLVDILKEIKMKPIKLMLFPEFRQTYDYDCGANALHAVLAYFGDDVAEGDLIIQLKTDPNVGTNIDDIVRVSEEYGIKCQVKHNMTIVDLKQNINNNVPTTILVQAWTENQNVNWKTDWEDGHYVTAIGYTDDSIIFEDPSSVVRTYIEFNELNKNPFM